MPKILIGAGTFLVVIGVVWLVGERLGLGRLPGDMVIRWGEIRIYLPIVTSITLSVLLSLVSWLWHR